MRKSDRLIKAGLLTAIIGLVSILNIFAFRATQTSTVSSIQGVAYFDCNYNGLKEIGETGFPNMDVLLTGRNSLGDTVTQVTTTDGAGLYAFTGVDAGTYRVKYTFPGTSVNLIFSPQNIGGDDGADSDPNAAGYTDSLIVDGISNIGAVDAGVIDSVCPVIYYTNPLIVSLLDGDTLTVGCDNIPVMDGTWARGVNNSGGADLPIIFERVLVRNGNCKQDGFVQFFVCTWTTQNLCNHQTQVRLYLKTIDTIPPTLTAPNDTTINLMLGDVVPAVPFSIPNNDNCSGTGSTVTYRDYETEDPCGKIITRIWAAEDACGNETIDTQRITVILNPVCDGAPATDTIVLTPFTMTGNTKDTCLAAYLGSDRVLKNTWTLSSTNGVSATVIGDSCVTLTRQPGFSGRDTVAGWHCDGANANCRFFLLVVNILPDDPSCHLVAVDTLVPLSVTCGSQGLYCLTGLNDINNFNNTYTIADNGAAYSGSFNSCSKDTTFSYAYYTLPFMGLSGKYRLDYWKLNGSDVTIASFDSLPQLVAAMNVNDPTGNWAIDSATYTITGGTTAQTYGQIRVTKLSNGAVGTANVATDIADNGIQMTFTGGLHTVIFTKTLTGCTDTLNVNVFCDTILLPVAVNDFATTKESIGITINTFVNDTLNGALIKPLSIITNPTNGLATVDGSNIIAYIPTVGFCGSNDSLSYEICNADGCDTAWVYVTINCPQPPVALDDVTSTTKNTDVTISALANDTTHGVLTQPLSIVTNPTNGTASVDGSNIITFSPTLDFCGGNDSLSYEICNADGCDTAWVYITINCPAVIGDPVAVDDNVIANKNTNLYFTPLVNDTINGTLLALGTVTAPNHGAVGFIGADSLVYTPLVDYCGNDTIEYRVCRTDFKCDTAFIYITVNCPVAGTAPVALDDAISTDKNVGITITALANDTTNGVLIQPLSIINYAGGASVSVDGSNNIVYTPQLDFCGGNDTLNYTICNANGCDTATVIVTVNCPPVLLYPIALTDTISTLKNITVNIDVLANDTTNGGLSQSAVIIQNPSNGTASFNGFNTIDYTPALDFCGGNDTLSYEICNVNGCDTGWVFINVNCPPVVLYPFAIDDVVSTDKNIGITINALANDTLNGALISPLSIVGYAGNATISVDGSNNIVYTPELDFCGGNDTVSYEICTATGCDTGWVFINVNCPPVVLYPFAINDVVSTDKNVGITIEALLNDTLNGALISPLSIVGYAGNATVSVDGSNNIVYTPELDFCGGNDTLSYEICNANGCDTTTVVVTINCPAILYPIAVDDVVSTDKNVGITINALANDTLNGVLISPLSIVGYAGNATVSVDGSNNIVYTPELDFCGGNDTVSYEICTATGCDTGWVFVTINCPAPVLLPVAMNDVVSTLKNTSITINALANDTLNGALISPLSIVGYTGNATISVDGSNNIVYTPELDFCGGNELLGYEICTANGCDTGWIFVTINCPPALKPDAVDDVATTTKNNFVIINVPLNDVPNGVLTRTTNIVKAPSNGFAIVNFTNKIVYTPALDFCGGNDTMSYEICNAVGCDTATVVVTVNCPAILYPIAVDDAVTTTKNNGIVIEALLNDTLNGVLISPLSIFNYTGNATVSVDGSNNIVYIPEVDFCGGNDTVMYEICTATGCDTGWAFITINCPPIVYPIAADDAVSTDKNTGITVSVLSNDIANGALVSPVSIINYAGSATVSVDINDNIVYTPALDFCGGNDTVYYSLCNASGCDTGKVVITVNCPAVGLYPIAVNDAVSTLKNASITINALSNDTINGGLKQSIQVIQNPVNGTASVNGFNYIVYNPQSNFCGGQDSLSYEICNANGCDTAWVYITINCPALVLPIANNDAVSTLKNAAITITALANDNTNGALISPLSIISSPSNGTVSVDGSNRIVYTPDLDFCGGNDILTYAICNADGCDTAIVIVTINCPVPVLPIATNDAVSTLKNTAITINVLLNDNTNGALISPLSIINYTGSATVYVDGSNNISYTPFTDTCGFVDTLTYRICNADGCDTATLLVTVTCPLKAPIAIDDAISLDENTFKLFKPTANDTLNGSLFAVNVITSPSNGAIGFISIDSLIYTPFIGFCGTDTITYSLCNQGRLCDTATIIATIICTDTTGNSQRPVAVDDAVSTLKNTPISISVIANDTVNGALSQPLSIAGNPNHGTAVVNGNQITYTPALDFCGGNDTLSYVICNVNGCDTGWAFITVNCTGGNNNANQPIALDDNLSTGRNTPFIFQPTKNDTIKGTLASLNIVSTAKHGTLAFAGIDSLVYYPQAGYCGNDTMIYSICNQFSLCDTATIIINITCDTVPTGNGKLPIAVDDLATTLKNTAVNIAVLTNDTINGGLTRPLSILGNPSNGTAVVLANDIVYTPQTGFCGGTDTVSYEICNANGCDTGFAIITVNCPIIILKPDAVNDVATTTKNIQVVIDVLANDTKNGTLTRTTNIIRQPSRGTAIVNFSNKIVYIPQAGFCGGSDTLTYEICNADGCDTALVIIDIQCVGSNPDAIDDVATVNKNVSTTLSVLSNDAINGTLIKPLSILTQPVNGTATVDANNNISYTPTTNFCGANDTLTYEICNNNGCDTARLIITVSCAFVVNRPDAVDDYTTTFKNTGINIDALANDQLNGVLDSISIINAPKNGTASVNGLKIQYQPDSTFCGSNDTMSYSICTSNGCDTAQVIVSVTCDIVSNTPPDAVDDARSTLQGRSLIMVVLANDLLHGAALDSAKIIQAPLHGSARFDAFGNIFYNPNANFCGGNDTLTYQICTQYGCDTALVVISVTCDSLFNRLPVANTDNAATARNISIIIPVLQNDTLNGADTFRIITFGKHGSAIFNNTNNIVYQPDSIFCNGKDTLVYEICNITGCATAKVIIDITCDSIAKLIPIANADTASTNSNEPVMIDITSNDTLRGANKPVIVNEPKKGIVTIAADNKALYIPNTDAFGRDTFSYVICNAFGCDTTTVGIFIMAGDSVKIFNGFSPNNDGMNDRFVIKGIENYPNNEVYIYNRWGVEVYKTKGYTNDNGWDGSWIGTYLPDGTYFIVIIFNDEKKQRKTGYIQIHR